MQLRNVATHATDSLWGGTTVTVSSYLPQLAWIAYGVECHVALGRACCYPPSSQVQMAAHCLRSTQQGTAIQRMTSTQKNLYRR